MNNSVEDWVAGSAFGEAGRAGAVQHLPTHGEHTADLNCWDARYSLEQHYSVRREERSGAGVRLFVLR